MTDRWAIKNSLIKAKHKHKDEELKCASGIYKITNIRNNHCYIGQSIDLLQRRKQHFQSLKHNNHPNRYLQNAYNYYGANNFHFDVLEFVRREELNEREQYWIDQTKAEYNLVRNVYDFWDNDGDRLNRDCGNGEYQIVGESFTRPYWHKFVYGGDKSKRTP